MTVKEAMSELGRIGGRVKSQAKAESSRKNGKLNVGRRKPTNTEINQFAGAVVDAWQELQK